MSSNKRELLKGILATSGAFIASGSQEARAEAQAKILEEKRIQEKVAELGSDWITKEHIQDLLALGFFAVKSGEAVHYSLHEWKHDTTNATLDVAPWGGPCTLVYEIHGHNLGNPVAPGDILTLEGVSPRKLEREDKLKIFEFQLCEDSPTKQLLDHNSYQAYYNVDTFMFPYELNEVTKLSREAETLAKILGLLVSAQSNELTPLAKSAFASLIIGNAIGMTGRSAEAYYSDSTSRHLTSVLHKTMESTHISLTHQILLSIRNDLAAVKNEFIAEQYKKETGEAPHVVTKWGYAHVGLETATMQGSSKALERLKRWKPFIIALFGTEEGNFSLWSVIEYAQDDVNNKLVPANLIEVPELKALFASPEKN